MSSDFKFVAPNEVAISWAEESKGCTPPMQFKALDAVSQRPNVRTA